MATELQGSWFPSGYYGHFRSKSRADFVCEYRQLAKPQPPNKFYNRAKEPTRKHVFSHHDNRQAFLNDAVVFNQGLGRRRVPNSTFQNKNDFMTWMPEREFVERSRPLASTYKVDFMKTGKQQILTKRPKTSFDGASTTSYRYSHGVACPNKEVIDANNYTALKLSLLNRKDRAMSAVYHRRETVASCLSWVPEKQKENVRPVIPDATTTTEFVPHPPSIPKQQSQPSLGPSSPPVIQEAWSAPAEATQQQQYSPPTTTYDPPPQQQQAQPTYEAPPPPPPQSEPVAQ